MKEENNKTGRLNGVGRGGQGRRESMEEITHSKTLENAIWKPIIVQPS